MTKKPNDITVIRDHLRTRHGELYGINYVTNSYAFEGRQLKLMIAEYGVDVVKRFVDECFNDYKPTHKYPGLNFAFMYSYQRSRVLPRVLADVKREQEKAGRKPAQEMSVEDFEKWM